MESEIIKYVMLIAGLKNNVIRIKRYKIFGVEVADFQGEYC